MALTFGPKLGLLVNGVQGELHYNELMKMWRGLDALIQASVKDTAIATPPGSPADGDCYIVAASPTGVWVGHATHIARYSSVATAWEYFTPKVGWLAWSEAASAFLKFSAGAWSVLTTGGSGAGTTVSATAPSTPTNGQGWFDTNSGITYTWVDDGVGAGQWVEGGPSGGRPLTRELLFADRTYYVSTTGSDSNNGLSAGAPFLTGQKAIDTAALLDTGIYNIAVQFADGTYTGPMVAKAIVGAGTLTLKGNVATPSNVFFNTIGNCLNNLTKTRYFISDCKLQSTTNCLYSQDQGSYIGFSNIVFGTATNNHILVFGGGFIQALGNYSIIGGAQSHWSNAYGNISVNVRTITITGTPNFSVAFLWGDRGQGMTDVYGNTFSGTATGKRYQLVGNGVCFVNGAAITYLPGDVAGTTATGGQYL